MVSERSKTPLKKILIVDEERFCRVCTALLGLVGIEPARIVCHTRFDSDHSLEGYELVITSFPYDSCLLERLQVHDIPAMVFSDCLSGELLDNLKKSANIGCMIKPIDFERFKELLGKLLQSVNSLGGCQIV
jgi:hypothetical protein